MLCQACAPTPCSCTWPMVGTASVPRFLTPRDQLTLNRSETGAELGKRIPPPQPLQSEIPVPYFLAVRACQHLNAPAVPTRRQLAAAILAYEHAIPELERPTAAQRMEAMQAALTAALREA